MPWTFMESLKVRLMRRRRRKIMLRTFMGSSKVSYCFSSIKWKPNQSEVNRDEIITQML